MKQYLLILLPITVFATPIADESLLASTNAVGTSIYASCILTPPTNDVQTSICVGMYATYMTQSQTLTAPLPMLVSKEPSPYAWSPYDICRFEVGNIIFGEQSVAPYCPTLPK